jgi:uncharacterized membrane protein
MMALLIGGGVVVGVAVAVWVIMEVVRARRPQYVTVTLEHLTEGERYGG